MLNTPGVEHCTTVIGYNMLSGVQNTYSAFFWISFKEWSDRKAPDEQYDAIKAHLNETVSQATRRRTSLVFAPPAIPGVGSGGLTVRRRGSYRVRALEFLTTNVEQVHGCSAKATGNRAGRLRRLCLPSHRSMST